jgi:hypothetical protein
MKPPYKGHVTTFVNVETADIVDAHLRHDGNVMLRFSTGDGIMCLTVSKEASDAIISALSDMDRVRRLAILPQEGLWLSEARARLAAEDVGMGDNEMKID